MNFPDLPTDIESPESMLVPTKDINSMQRVMISVESLFVLTRKSLQDDYDACLS
jgi:hypothetical protein